MLNNHINEDSAIMSCLCRRCELGITLNTLIYIGAKHIFMTMHCVMFTCGRQLQVLWFTCQREYRKCREQRSSINISEDERNRRQIDPNYSDYWQKLVDVEESTAAFLTAIATLIEDAAEITLQLYIIIGHGVQENAIGQFTNQMHYMLQLLPRPFINIFCDIRETLLHLSR